MRKNESVTHIMSKDIRSVEEGQSLSVVRQLMTKHSIHHVPVVNAGTLIGLVSFTDMMKVNLAVQSATDHTIDTLLDQQFSLKDVMTEKVTTIHIKDSIRSAAQTLSSGEFHSLPVVDDNKQLLGIVTSTDLIRYLSAQY